MRRLQTLRAVRLTALVAVLALGLSGCASSGTPTHGPGAPTDADKVLLDRGTQALKDHKWSAARQYFTKLLDSYPQSEYRADAKLGVGDSYLGEGNSGSYVFALNEYREFLSFYPTNPHADYAQYQLASVHYKQMLSRGRDSSETRDAVKEFQAFVDKYPKSSILADGQKRLREAKDRLGDDEFGVGQFYLRIKWYPGAVDRFKRLLTDDPGYTHKDALYFNLGDALEKSKKEAEALPYYERLVAEFEQSQYLEEAKRRIAVLKPTLADP
ncbi:MAG TPA: outer membrane protein assembly factor BamD [Vicinamibacterales bacterium]|jgi:outer membrane protein assembly factor BamD|nr:outer membrane protein assembly factor BamD [Vicinamibacterales bacterium]